MEANIGPSSEYHMMHGIGNKNLTYQMIAYSVMYSKGDSSEKLCTIKTNEE